MDLQALFLRSNLLFKLLKRNGMVQYWVWESNCLSSELYSPVQWLDCVRTHEFCLAKPMYSSTKALHRVWLRMFANFSMSFTEGVLYWWILEPQLHMLVIMKGLLSGYNGYNIYLSTIHEAWNAKVLCFFKKFRFECRPLTWTVLNWTV